MSSLPSLTPIRSNRIVVLLLFPMLLAACMPGAELLNRVPVHSVEFKVQNHNNEPIAGASVEASNGRAVPTDESGTASIRFGSIGIHTVTISAPDFMPTSMTVTLPADNNEVKTVNLARQVNPASGSVAGMFSGMGSAQVYPMMFSYLFNSFGFSTTLTEYHPGEWTQWHITAGQEDDEPIVLRKAFLKENDEGQQWWQLQMLDEEGTTAEYTAELLFDAERSSIRRYREQIGEGEPREKPVTDSWYSQPNELTPESIEAAVVEEKVSLSVPKGTFTADLITFGAAPEVDLNIWRVSGVPGGTAQYSTTQEGETVYRSQLSEFGNDAKTLLSSY